MSLFLRNLFFTILQPGIVAGLVPFLLTGKTLNTIIEPPLFWYHFIGLIIFVIGFILMSVCIINFAVRGKGTLSPADPTKKLVIAGPYKFSRNPMYVGVMMLLIGEAIFFQSLPIGFYSLIIFIAFYTFVVFFEEPRLLESFGDDYKKYTNSVRRWL